MTRTPLTHLAAAEYAEHFAVSREEDIPADVRPRVRASIAAGIRADKTITQIADTLFARFGTLNLDWSIIALEEVGECLNQAAIICASPGDKAIWMAPFAKCCPACDVLHEQKFDIVSVDTRPLNLETQLWVGKDWRDRLAGEVWPGAGIQGPMCRGSWSIRSKPDPRVSPEFVARLEAKVEGAMRTSKRPKYY